MERRLQAMVIPQESLNNWYQHSEFLSRFPSVETCWKPAFRYFSNIWGLRFIRTTSIPCKVRWCLPNHSRCIIVLSALPCRLILWDLVICLNRGATFSTPRTRTVVSQRITVLLSVWRAIWEMQLFGCPFLGQFNSSWDNWSETVKKDSCWKSSPPRNIGTLAKSVQNDLGLHSNSATYSGSDIGQVSWPF